MSDENTTPKGPRSVQEWYNVPEIQRKLYAKNARITRNQLKHEAKFPGKLAQNKDTENESL